MPQKLVADLKKGSILNANVVSSLGSVIMEKGTKVLDREYEILLAFQIESVNIEQKFVPEGSFTPSIFSQPGMAPTIRNVRNQLSIAPSAAPNRQEASSGMKKAKNFEDEFIHITLEIKKMIDSVSRGMPILIHDLREQLMPLLAFDYDPAHVLVTTKQVYAVEDYLYFHSVAVGYIAACIAKWARIPVQEILDVAITGALHDIGKTKVSTAILKKQETLTNEEWKEVKKYPVYGYHLIKSLPYISDSITLGVLQHQEREDRSGYPLSLPSGSIHDYAKMVAIADMFHAMCSLRPYGQAKSPYLALEEILTDSFGKLNPEYVRIFVDSMTHFSIGTEVELNDGSVGRIVFVDSKNPTRPMVDVNGTIINLALNRNLVILKVSV